MLELDGVAVDVPPEVADGRDALHAAAAVRTVVALDHVVDVLAGVLRLRHRPVDEQCEVGEAAEHHSVVEVAVVEAVLVALARLAEVGQLVELVRAAQAVRSHAVRRRVGGAQVVPDRALDPHVGDVQRPVVAAVSQHGQPAGGGAHQEARLVDGHVSVGVEDVALQRVPVAVRVGEARVAHDQVPVDVDEH